MNVFLMGMPGSGKSTAGKKLAAKLSLDFIDLDGIIEERTKKRISAVFSEEGEAAFRLLEKQCLEEIIQQRKNYVLALGGGTPCFFNNLQLINASGISVYIELPAAALCKRIMQGTGQRPLFIGMDERQVLVRLRSLLGERDRFYSEARITVLGTSLDVESLAALIRLQPHSSNETES